MAKAKPNPASVPPSLPSAEYTVVARRYRPQQFAELIGQEHVAAALVNALQSGRVAHAYLFTGARGVGKTSAARILAKALNCEKGPTATPCDQCDSCKAIAEGQDVDVVEIDGASNRGIENARELRQNSGFRPTRGRYKVYIIDEVHMLTTPAFNALLKTLEEPPEHVKFILATTEVQNIPITILSRCQRFDFAHVGPAKIFEQLKAIVAREKYEADDDALKLVARRAAGSMRDSQSLLDQLLASSPGRLTAEHVHAVLGTAGDERVTELAASILNQDPKAALNLIGTWSERGLQIGELLDQLIDYWRALMLCSCGPELTEIPVGPNQREMILRQSRTVSLDTILAGLEVWTATKARLRGSGHGQVLLEMAVVRLSRLGELLSVGQLAQTLVQPGGALPPTGANGARPAPPNRPQESADPSKKNGLMSLNGATVAGENAATTDGNANLPLNPATVPDVWGRLIRNFAEKSPLLANHLKFASLPAIFGPNSLAIRFESGYNLAYEACATEFNVAKIQDALRRIVGQPVTVRIDLERGGSAPKADAPPGNPQADRKKELLNLPLFRKAADVLGAQVWHLDPGFNPVVVAPSKPAAPDEIDEAAAPETDPDEA